MSSPLLVDILAYWNLNNNGSGGVSIVDSTGNGYTLTNNNGVALGAGIIGGCAVFNSPNLQNLTFSTNSALDFGTNDFSVSMWVKPSALNSVYANVFGVGTTYDQGCIATWVAAPGIAPDSARIVQYVNSDLASTSGSIVLEVWNNLVYTRSGGVLYIYINGVLNASGVFTAPMNFNLDGTAFLGGQGWDGAQGQYYGSLDEVGIWNRVLTPNEVYSLYSGGSGNTYPFLPNSYSTLYYNNAESDGDWGNILNWWSDNTYTTQATALPANTNPVYVTNVVSQNTQGADQCFCALGDFRDANFGTALTLQSSGVVNFYGSSVLSGNTTASVSMHDSSYIDIPSTIGGNATLRDASLNTGTINGNATVYYDGGQGTYPIGGTVLGTVTYFGFNFGQTCYFNNAVNRFLGTVGNWWQDSEYTIPTGFVPNSTNAVVFNSIIIQGITGVANQSVTYKSIISNASEFYVGNYEPFTLISTNGITATNSGFYLCTINANGTYTGCAFDGEDGVATIIGNINLYNCIGIYTDGSNAVSVTSFTGVVNAYYPTYISSGAVNGTLIRHGYTLNNTCIAHCNLNETSGTRTVLDLYEEIFLSTIVIIDSGVSNTNGTYTRSSGGSTTFNGPNGYSLIDNGGEWQIQLGGGDYYFTTDFVDWFSTNSVYNPPPTTQSTSNSTTTVGYGTGLIGNAAKFNNNSLVNPNPIGGDPFQLEVQFSISVWVNFPVVPSTPPQAIVGTGYEYYPNSLTINVENSKLGLFVDATTGGQITGPTVAPNTWHNCVVTCTTNSIKFYVDSVFKGQFATSLFYTAGVFLSKYLGGYQLTNNALVDEFNLFNLDLNQDQINQLYNGGAGSTFPFINYGGGAGTINFARMLHLPFFFDSRKPSLARLLYLPWFINI